jgi:hypothetical protein
MKIRDAIAAITGSKASGYPALMSLLCIIVPASINAQSITAYNGELDTREIRSEQRRLAAEAGVRVQEFDTDGRAISNLQDIPPEIKDLKISDERNLIESVIPAIYKYYGFVGTETLRFISKQNVMGEARYDFVKYINNIETPSFFTVRVDLKSNRIIGVGGGLDIDTGYDVEPILREQEAVELAIESARREELASNSSLYDTDNRRAIKAQIIYVRWGGERGLQPAWRINIPIIDPNDLKTAFKPFVVNPDGSVQSNRGVDFLSKKGGYRNKR